MMRLGSYEFAIDTAAYQKLRRTDPYRWAQQDRLKRYPAQQYVGPDAPTIRLQGVIYPTFKGGLEQIKTMRSEADKGKPLMLIDGQGRVWGFWCITEIREDATIFLPGGAPKKQEFDLRLVYFGEEG